MNTHSQKNPQVVIPFTLISSGAYSGPPYQVNLKMGKTTNTYEQRSHVQLESPFFGGIFVYRTPFLGACSYSTNLGSVAGPHSAARPATMASLPGTETAGLPKDLGLLHAPEVGEDLLVYPAPDPFWALKPPGSETPTPLWGVQWRVWVRWKAQERLAETCGCEANRFRRKGTHFCLGVGGPLFSQIHLLR